MMNAFIDLDNTGRVAYGHGHSVPLYTVDDLEHFPDDGRPTEVNVLSGAVSRYAEAAGIPAPIHDTLTAALV
jgi:hypothetical protein